MASPTSAIQDFLEPLHIDLAKVHLLSQSFLRTFGKLALESQNQFLPTPITESILRPAHHSSQGW